MKLPYTAGGILRGRKLTYKTAKGFDDLLRKIRMFLNNPEVLGYIPYALIQPRIHDNTEAKVSSITFRAAILLQLCTQANN